MIMLSFLEIGRLIDFVPQIINEAIYFHDAFAIAFVLLLVMYLLNHGAEPIFDLGNHIVLSRINLE